MLWYSIFNYKGKFRQGVYLFYLWGVRRHRKSCATAIKKHTFLNINNGEMNSTVRKYFLEIKSPSNPLIFFSFQMLKKMRLCRKIEWCSQLFSLENVIVPVVSTVAKDFAVRCCLVLRHWPIVENVKIINF